MSHLEMLATHYAAVQARLGMPAPKRHMALVPRPIIKPRPVTPEPIVVSPNPEPEVASASMPGEFPLLPGATILAEVTDKHGVTIRALKGASLARDVTAARAEACWRLRNELGWSWARVADAVGRWDHTTAIAAYRRYEQILLGVRDGKRSTTREVGGRLYPSSGTKRGEVMDFLLRNIGRPVKLSLIAKSTSVGRKSRVQNHIYHLRSLYGLEIENLGRECVRLTETPRAIALAEALGEDVGDIETQESRMSRIRSIHPGLWTDDAFMSLSAHARLLYIGLLNEAWDDGVFEWKPLTLKARIFPADNVDIPSLLDELVRADKIAVRTLPKRYGIIRNFREFQRPKKPNSSGLLHADDHEYVGLVENQSGTGGEKPPQMEDGGWKREEKDVENRPSLSEPGERARDFDEIWETFPRNPGSNEIKAASAFDALTKAEKSRLADAVRRYRRWFAEDCEARKRTFDAGLRYVPHLSTWIEDGGWKHADDLPIRGGSTGPVVAMVRLDRDKDRELWLECERLSKPAPTSDTQWAFRGELVERARDELAKRKAAA